MSSPSQHLVPEVDRAELVDVSRRALARFPEGNILISERFTPASYPASKPTVSTAPLSGMTAVIKDIIDVAGMVTTNGSALHRSRPAEHSADVVRALEQQGAVIVGKANLDEFAWGVTGNNVRWGTITNPRYPALVTGGSSGGTAAAIAAGVARIGLGTDTAGSVRIPAACCGVIGLRPRTGVISAHGVQGLAPSFDVVGPMAGTVADCVHAWEALSGDLVPQKETLRGLRLAVLESCRESGKFAELGAETVDVETPRSILEPFWVVMRAEAWRTHSELFEARSAEYSPGVRTKLEAAALVTDEEERSARARMMGIREEFMATIAEFDGVIMPTLGRPAPESGCDESAIRDELGWIAAMVSALDLASVAIGNVQIVARTEVVALQIARVWETEVGEVPPPW